MSKGRDEFDFTWGLPALDDLGYLKVYTFMLRVYTDLGLTRTEMLLMIHLASYHYNSPTGESRPSLATIAEEMGYSNPGSVARVVESLEKKGVLRVIRTPGFASTYNAAPFAALAYAKWGERMNGQATPRNFAGGTPRNSARTPRAILRDEEEERILIQEEEEVLHGHDGGNATENSKSSRGSTETGKLPKRVVQATGDPMADRAALNDAGANAILSTEEVAKKLQGAVLGPGARWPEGNARSAKAVRGTYIAVAEQILQTVGWEHWVEVVKTINWMDAHITFTAPDRVPDGLDAAWLSGATSPGAWKSHVISHTLRRMKTGGRRGGGERLVFDE